MNLIKQYNLRFYTLFLICFLPLLACADVIRADYQINVLSMQQFQEGINAFHFFKKNHQTTTQVPLDKYEKEMIATAQSNHNKCFGGTIDPERKLEQFSGNTLLVGGGKDLGHYGSNQGKTLLYNIEQEIQKIDDHITLLTSKQYTSDPYTGISFTSDNRKQEFIDHLRQKKMLYTTYYQMRNNDILEKYFTINIDSSMQPDIHGSIACISDVVKIPDNTFARVEFENVPCDVFLDSKLYTILERITQPDGIITLSITNACRRVMIPVITNTKFGEQYIQSLVKEYARLEQLHPTYHRISIDIINN